MGGYRSVEKCFSLKILVAFILVFAIRFSHGATNPNDVAAMNSLYIALASPPLPGWVASGGDPCGEAWQGVQCHGRKTISSIKLDGANLGGELGESLEAFSSINSIELSNNLIGGSIPTKLPTTLKNIFLSDNEFTGSIPSSISSLRQLSALSLNNNELTGEIPDSFEGLTALVNLDLSNNNLSGHLPPSLRNLTSLTTLRLQNNRLSGALDVLQDLPLRDLNIENNLFSGPIPPRLLSIPNFRSNGNPFQSSIAPAAAGQTPPISGRRPGGQADGPSAPNESNSVNSKKSSSIKRIVWISIAAALLFLVLVLAILLCVPRCLEKRRETYRTPKPHEIAPFTRIRDNHRYGGSLVPRLQPSHDKEKVNSAPTVAVVRPNEENQQEAVGSVPKPGNENNKKMTGAPKPKHHKIDMRRFEMPPPLPPPPSPPPPLLPPPPPPPPFHLSEKTIVKPIAAAEATATKSLTRHLPATSVKAYTIASLQQYTNRFSQENLIGEGMFGNIYRAQLPDGRLLAVMKLDKKIVKQHKDDQFLELVNSLDKIHHANVVELMGYCAEHDQRLLIYEYCSKGTLQDALHSNGEFKKNLSWNTRIRMALGAARALEYLHEVCEPPIIHSNFKSANVLLDDELSIHVSDCGLAPLKASGAVSQLSGQLLTTYSYGAPEFESGTYTSKSDVYSYGVVMLELLTGRTSYDRTRSPGEQILVRWAVPQLHDIDSLSRMVDPALYGEYPVQSLSQFADIISRCVQPEPESRPSISEVVQELVQMIQWESPDRSDGE